MSPRQQQESQGIASIILRNNHLSDTAAIAIADALRGDTFVKGTQVVGLL